MSNYPDDINPNDPSMPWNATEEVLLCPECQHEDDAARYEGEECPECGEGIMQYGVPEPYEPDWDSMPGGWDDRD